MIKIYKNESELCEGFIKHNSSAWIAYPETCGFDILMVRKEDGFQVGIEAKLKLNAKVICQAAEPVTHWFADMEGPDCRAILIPWGKTSELAALLPFLGITPIFFSEGLSYSDNEFTQQSPMLPDKLNFGGDSWFELCVSRRCTLPGYVPDVRAGIPGPIMLTPWKIKAIKLAIILDKVGYLTRADFKYHQISITMWVNSRWIISVYGKKTFVANNLPKFKEQHPVNYAQIEVDYDTWKQKVG